MKTLGDVIKIETGEQLNKSDMLPDAEHPVVNGGIDFSGYTDKYNSEANTITISQGGASAGYVNWLNQKFWAGAHCYVVTPLPNNDVRFLYHFIKSREYNFMKNQQGAGIPSLNRSEVYKTAFPDFDYNKQKEIAEILDSFTSMIMNLETELASRQKQYEHYRNELLTFDLNDENVEWKTLGEIGAVVRGNGLQKTDFSEEGVGCVHYGQIYTRLGFSIDKTLTFVPEELAEKLTQVEPGNLIIACTSENVEDVCKSVVWLGTETIVTGGHACVFKHNENPKYVGYCFLTNDFFNQKKKYAYGAKVIDIKTEKLALIKIPVPKRSLQDNIVEKLDKFEALIANIKQELEARKKQYEYYREQLLTFRPSPALP